MFFAYVDEWFDAVGTKIGVHRGKVHIKSRSGQMTSGVCLRSGSDVASLDVSDHDQPFGPAVSNGLLVGDHSGNTELLIHCHLRLHGGDQLINRVHDRLVELPYRLGGDQIFFLTVRRDLSLSRRLCLFKELSGNKGKIGVKSDDDRRVLFGDLTDQFLDHSFHFPFCSKSYSCFILC